MWLVEIIFINLKGWVEIETNLKGHIKIGTRGKGSVVFLI